MRNRLVVLLAAGAIVVSACGASATPAPTTAPTAAPPASLPPSVAPSPSAAGVPDLVTTNYKPEAVGNTGGKLVYSTSGEPNSIWYGIYDNFAADVEAFGPSLWSLWSNTADFKYYGQLATNVPTTTNGGVTVNGDKMDVKIDLIPGAQWSDGQPITCQDLVDEWHWFMSKDQVGNIQGTTGWEDITGVDGGTGTSCVAHFSKLYEQYLSLWTPLLPGHYINSTTVAKAQDDLYTHGKAEDVAKGVYSGPYIPTAWVAGSEIDYVPNPKFWDTIKKSTVGAGSTKAPFDSVVFKFYSDPQAEIAGFVQKEADVAIEFNHNHLALIKAANIPDNQVDTIDGVTYEHNSWNYKSLTDKYGADGAKALMTALHYAYNKDEINQRVLGGSATPSCSFVSPLAWFYHDVPCYTYDVAKANSILDAAGFTKGSDGMRVAPAGSPTAGKPLDLVACTRADRQYRVDTLRLVSSQLEAVGIKLNLDHVAADPSVLFSGWSGPDAAPADAPCNLTRGNFDVTEFAWVSTPDPMGIYGLYLSSKDPSLGDHSGSNYIRVNNPDLDNMLNESLRSVDLKLVGDDLAKIQDLYVNPDNAFPEIALYNWRTVLLKADNMHNVVNNSTAVTQTWNIEDWWRSP